MDEDQDDLLESMADTKGEYHPKKGEVKARMKQMGDKSSQNSFLSAAANKAYKDWDRTR